MLGAKANQWHGILDLKDLRPDLNLDGSTDPFSFVFMLFSVSRICGKLKWFQLVTSCNHCIGHVWRSLLTSCEFSGHWIVHHSGTTVYCESLIQCCHSIIPKPSWPNISFAHLSRSGASATNQRTTDMWAALGPQSCHRRHPDRPRSQQIHLPRWQQTHQMCSGPASLSWADLGLRSCLRRHLDRPK